MSESESSSCTEMPASAPVWDRDLDSESVRRGFRALGIMMALALLVSLAASIAFATGRFDDYPYSWF